MSSLSDFLNPLPLNEVREVIISKRFVQRDEKGNPVMKDGEPVLRPFKIRTVSQEENESIAKQATHTVKVNGKVVKEMDDLEYSRRLVVAATLEPDFSSKETCDSVGVLDPLMVPGRMLSSGEYAKLANAIMKLSGFDGEDPIGAEIKN